MALSSYLRRQWWRVPIGLRGFCTADEDKYLELKQLKDIKSEEFYDQQAHKRRYFYYIDLQGRLFLEDTRPKNIATSLKSAKFLRFFFSQCKSKEEEAFLEYPFRSPCGKEMNFIKCADRPFVFEDLRRDESSSKWTLDLATKHVTSGSPDGIALVRSQLAVELGKHIDVHDFPDDVDAEQGVRDLVIGDFEWDSQPMSSTPSNKTDVSTGNRVAQFIVITAVISVLYQIFTRPAVVSTPPPPSTASPLGSGYRTGEDSRRFTSSEITGFLLFLGLFGLLQHKKKQDKKADIEAEQRQIARIVQSQRNSLKNGVTKVSGTTVTNLPRDVLHELLLFLSPKDLATCPMVCRAWEFNVGDAAGALWRRVFQRDFNEPGDRFLFYFRHHLSRAVELARLLGIKENRKCVAIEGQVYDVTDFLDLHPGGPHVIGDAVGTDATAKESMQQFLVYDQVLARPESERLRGNLDSVVTRWSKTSWALSHSHYLDVWRHSLPTLSSTSFARYYKQEASVSMIEFCLSMNG
ncbi:Protein of unknown function DUF4505 [Phytophthora cactorum]|nr:Protein of unknown function DUF4505 [Phytophthora cactorum]